MKRPDTLAKIFICSVAMFVTVAFIAHADPIKYTLLSPPPGITGVSGSNPFGDYLKGAIPFILRLAAVLAVVKIVIGGFEYALSEAITSKQEAKEDITQAIIGLLIALMSYLILNTINPALVKLEIPLPKLDAPPASQTNQEPPPAITTFSTICSSDMNACVVTAGAGANGASEDRCGSPCPSGTNAADILHGENWCKVSSAGRGPGSCTKKSYDDCVAAQGSAFKFQDQCENSGPPGQEIVNTDMIICLLNEIPGTNSGDCKVTSLTGNVPSCITNGGSKFDTAPTPNGACPTKFTCNSWQGSKPVGCTN